MSVMGGGCRYTFPSDVTFPTLILAVWADRRPAALLGHQVWMEAPVTSTCVCFRAHVVPKTTRAREKKRSFKGTQAQHLVSL